MSAKATTDARLDAFIQDNRSDFENRLAELVEIPTISMDPERKPDIQRGAELARQYLEIIGARAELVETPGNQVVFGRVATGDPLWSARNDGHDDDLADRRERRAFGPDRRPCAQPHRRAVQADLGMLRRRHRAREDQGVLRRRAPRHQERSAELSRFGLHDEEVQSRARAERPAL